MVSCQKGPTRHAYAWQIGPFWYDTLEISSIAGQALGVELENFTASTEERFVRHLHSVLNNEPFVNKPICLDAPDDGDIWMRTNIIVHSRDHFGYG